MTSILAGLVCWIVGDGRSLGVRVPGGRRSFMRYVYRPAFYTLCCALAIFLAKKTVLEHVSVEKVEPFEFDPRLFPDNTPGESKT